MRGIWQFTLAAIVFPLAAVPGLAQSPGSETMPVGVQNPALIRPQPVTPLPPVHLPGGAQPVPQPQLVQPYQPGPTPGQPVGSALIRRDVAGGLCECLIGRDPNVSVFDKTKMHQACLASVDACQAACNTQRYFSFVPHAIYTCPGRSIDRNGVALNRNGAGRRLLAQR